MVSNESKAGIMTNMQMGQPRVWCKTARRPELTRPPGGVLGAPRPDHEPAEWQRRGMIMAWLVCG